MTGDAGERVGGPGDTATMAIQFDISAGRENGLVARKGLSVAVVTALVLVAGFAISEHAHAFGRPVTVASFLDYRDGNRIVVTGTGKYATWNDLAQHAVFTFSRDTRRSLKCSGRCSRVWIPVITSGALRVKAGSHVLMRLLGTIRRPDGQLQVTYNHEPLYRPPDQNICRDTISAFGGTFAWIDVGGTRPVGVCGPY